MALSHRMKVGALTGPRPPDVAKFSSRNSELAGHRAQGSHQSGMIGTTDSEHRPRSGPRGVGKHGFKNVAEQSYAMAAEISDRVREIAEARGLSESEVFGRAIERGLEDLWEDLVLAQYLDGKLNRDEAIDRVGRTKVERAEREREVIEEDVDWGLNA